MPSWRDLRKFCERDGWDLYKETDHYYYRRDDETGGAVSRHNRKYLAALKSANIFYGFIQIL